MIGSRARTVSDVIPSKSALFETASPTDAQHWSTQVDRRQCPRYLRRTRVRVYRCWQRPIFPRLVRRDLRTVPTGRREAQEGNHQANQAVPHSPLCPRAHYLDKTCRRRRTWHSPSHCYQGQRSKAGSRDPVQGVARWHLRYCSKVLDTFCSDSASFLACIASHRVVRFGFILRWIIPNSYALSSTVLLRS